MGNFIYSGGYINKRKDEKKDMGRTSGNQLGHGQLSWKLLGEVNYHQRLFGLKTCLSQSNVVLVISTNEKGNSRRVARLGRLRIGLCKGERHGGAS